MKTTMRFRGCIPANLLPFTADLEIDEPAYRKHLRWLADTKGVTGIVANGHAAEVSSLTREERKRSLTIAAGRGGGRGPADRRHLLGRHASKRSSWRGTPGPRAPRDS